MYYFCEECGGKNDIEQDANGTSLQAQCRVCGEFLHLQQDLKTYPADGPATENQVINVMIVDDSGLMRKAVRRIFEPAAHIQIAGEAENGAVALELLPRLQPDVITLDINMPVMDGLTALKHIMILRPTPTVMFSTLTRAGSAAAFRALQYGAVDVMHKPSQVARVGMDDQNKEIIRKVALASDVGMDAVRYIRNPATGKPQDLFAPATCQQVVTIGAAEGGFGGLLKAVPRMSADTTAAFLIMLYADAQHVDDFTTYLDRLSSVHVRRAKNGVPLRCGECHIAAAGEYITVAQVGSRPFLRVESAPFESQRGSINMLMFSAAEVFGPQTTGVVLSGMGSDGEEGLREITRNGGLAIVQDPRTCLYKEMTSLILSKSSNYIVAGDGQLASHINAQIYAEPSVVDHEGYAVTAY